MLELRKVADTSKGERVTKYDPDTGAAKLVNPETEGDEHEPWPLKHVELVGEAPKEHNFADTFVARALADGYLEFKNPHAVSTETTIPGRQPRDTVAYSRGPVITGDEIILHLNGGDLRYKILEHPGRYYDESSESGDLEHHEYRCRLVKGE